MASLSNLVGFVLALGYVTLTCGHAKPEEKDEASAEQAFVSKPLGSLVAEKGSDVTLHCVDSRWSKTYVGDPHSFTWTKDGKQIHPSANVTERIYQLPNGSLVIRSFKTQPNSGKGVDGEVRIDTDVGKYHIFNTNI